MINVILEPVSYPTQQKIRYGCIAFYIFGKDGDLFSFRYGIQNIRFRTSFKLEREVETRNSGIIERLQGSLR